MYKLGKITEIKENNQLSFFTDKDEYINAAKRRSIAFQIHESNAVFELDVYEKDDRWIPFHVFHASNDLQVCPMCKKLLEVSKFSSKFVVITPMFCKKLEEIKDQLFQELLTFKNSQRLRMQLEFPTRI